jgi:2'-5' RNA ligase
VYGFTFKDPECLKDFFKDVKPFVIRLNKTSMFTLNSTMCDVLKVSVNSPDLQNIYQELKLKFQPKKQFIEYNPHCTVAYLKKGYVEKYLDKDFSEYSFTVNDVFFSYENKKTTIKLTGR